MRIILMSFILFISIVSCNNEDPVKEISKEGSIETSISIEHKDSLHDVITTTHKVWIHNKIVKKSVYNDTIPALKDSAQVAEQIKNGTKSVLAPKDYEVYITVK